MNLVHLSFIFAVRFLIIRQKENSVTPKKKKKKTSKFPAAATTMKLKLEYPDTATDEFNNVGTWTITYNQVNKNDYNFFFILDHGILELYLNSEVCLSVWLCLSVSLPPLSLCTNFIYLKHRDAIALALIT